MVKIGLKWSKMVKIVKMVKNGGPELKRARRTGRRARRTKSRGPKGLQLEVGAQRAPRLLGHDNNCFLSSLLIGHFPNTHKFVCSEHTCKIVTFLQNPEKRCDKAFVLQLQLIHRQIGPIQLSRRRIFHLGIFYICCSILY